MANNDLTPTDLEHSLTLDILGGAYEVGSTLPTIRELAKTYDLNPSTIQRVVTKLETRGLISPRQGNGLQVNDPYLEGDLSLLPYWIEVAYDDPSHAARILNDILRVRRVLASGILARDRELLLANLESLIESSGAIMNAAGCDQDALRIADFAFARNVLQLTGNIVVVMMLNTIARLLDQIPIIAQAMYAQPEENLTANAKIMQALVEGPDNLAEVIEHAMAKVDNITVTHFEAALRARSRENK